MPDNKPLYDDAFFDALLGAQAPVIVRDTPAGTIIAPQSGGQALEVRDTPAGRYIVSPTGAMVPLDVRDTPAGKYIAGPRGGLTPVSGDRVGRLAQLRDRSLQARPPRFDVQVGPAQIQPAEDPTVGRAYDIRPAATRHVPSQLDLVRQYMPQSLEAARNPKMQAMTDAQMAVHNARNGGPPLPVNEKDYGGMNAGPAAEQSPSGLSAADLIRILEAGYGK